MCQISMFKHLLLFAVLCTVGLGRPSDDDGLIKERAGGPQPSADYPLDEEPPLGEEDEEEPDEEEKPSGVQPVIRNQGMEISVDEGDSVNLPCDVENADQYVTVWRNGTQMIYQEKTPLISYSNRVFLKGYALQIQNVTRYDSGIYTCAVLSADEKGPRVSHKLHVKEPAKIDVFLPRGPKQIVEKGKSLSLVCHATGYPQPTVFWTRRVKGSNNPERLDGTNYTIPSVGREHSGLYECVAKNIEKAEKQNVEILVHYAPEVTIKGDTINTAEGKVSEMYCTVYAEPPASLVWLKDDKVIQGNDHIQLYQDHNKPHRHVLKIENTKAEDFGTYYCIANNSMGTTRKPMVLSDNMSNEIQQGPLEPNPNSSSQLRISLALGLSILVAMVYC